MARLSRPYFDVVLPTYNEEKVLEGHVERAVKFLRANMRKPFIVIIADGGSTDCTAEIGERLERRYRGRVKFLNIHQRGRGLALARAWDASGASLHTYMDIDLSTDLHAFPRMIQTLEREADLVIGNRLSQESKRQRSLKREILSRGYNTLARLILGMPSTDLQCGFKGIRDGRWREVRGAVKAAHWFFDTELAYWCWKKGWRVSQLPVDWIESERSSRVRVASTVSDFLGNLLRLRMSGGLGRRRGDEATF